jgi:NADPH-dependent curcumin reductase CurA
VKSREWRLAARPQGMPKPADFELAEVEVGEPDDGQAVIRNAFMSVDPYMRGRMNDVKSYVPPFQLGEVLYGGAVGEVIASRNERLAEGDWVSHQLGWRELAVSDGRGVQRVDPSLAPPQAYLSVLGMIGLTAYVGVLDIGQPKEGETVFVSGAAGAVGSLAGQIARIKGCRVIGSAGSDEKVAWLRDELGFDRAFNYKTASLK